MAKRRKSKTKKVVKAAKRTIRRTGAGLKRGRKESSPRNWHGVNASVGVNGSHLFASVIHASRKRA